MRAAVALCALVAALIAPSAALALETSSTSSQPSTNPITLGQSLTDAATVSGDGVIAPTGTVNFSVCGPAATGCTSGGTAVGTAQTLTPNLDFTSSATSDSFTPTAAGNWCFRADYSGDGVTYDPSSDGSMGECFTVNQASSGTSSSPQSPSIVLGSTNTDNVTVTGNTAGGSPTGTVDFSVCGPGVSSCTTGGTSAGSVSLSASGDGQSSTASSPAFTPDAAGTYCFRADYQSDSNYTGSSDGSSDECFTVTQATPSASSTPQSASIALGASDTDNVTVTGNSAGGSPTGTVDFSVCGPLSSASGCATGGSSAGSDTLTASGDGKSSTAGSPAFTPAALGTYCFRADYQSDTNYTAASDGSSDECFTVTQATPSTSSSPQTASFVLGGSNTDNVTVTGNATGGSPSGTVDFSVCGPLSGASGCATGGTSAGSSDLIASGDGESSTASSPSFTPSAAGTYCSRADYAGDTNYNGSSDGTSDECFTVGKATPTVNSKPQSETTTEAGTDADVTTVTGGAGTPTGTVNFSICGPMLSASSGCKTGGASAGSATLGAPLDGHSATATSPPFKPTASGVYCFRADYPGDSDYNEASDANSAVSCFTVPEPGAPSASISSPAPGAFYAVGQAVPASYGCAEASGGPGISSCSGAVANGSNIDTSTLGPHTFTVTATSGDRESTPVTVGYTVAAAPSATITSPKDGATYTLGSIVSVGFGCSEGQYGSGLADCNAPSGVDTNSLGTHSFSVTAASTDGQQSTSTVHYNVARPSNLFKVSKLKARQTGLVSFSLAVPGGGKVAIIETAPRSALPKGKPKPGRLTFASLKLNPTAKATLRVKVKPNATGRSLVKHHRSTLKVRLTITFTPVNGKPRTREFSGLRVGR